MIGFTKNPNLLGQHDAKFTKMTAGTVTKKRGGKFWT